MWGNSFIANPAVIDFNQTSLQGCTNTMVQPSYTHIGTTPNIYFKYLIIPHIKQKFCLNCVYLWQYDVPTNYTLYQ